MPAVLTVLLIAALAVWFWRRRQNRRRMPGRRRSVRPVLFGWSSVVIGTVLSLFFLWQIFDGTIVFPRSQAITSFLVSAAVSAVLAQYWFGIAQRLQAAPEVLMPSVAAVLYLRAFDAEHRPFVSGPTSVLKRYTKRWDAHVPRLNRLNRDPTLKLTLEDYLEEAITERIGPFVGLGNPRDRLPPDGAVREYAPDAVWQERFLALAHAATAIVVALGESDNLLWELKRIREEGLCRKVCLFTAPRPCRRHLPTPRKGRRLEAGQRSAGAEAWTRASAALRAAGYECAADHPGPGAVIGFDDDGRSVLLTTEASAPPDYVGPLADWFATGTRTGRCIAGSCLRCHAIVHHAVNETDPGQALCYVCEGEATLARMSWLERTFEQHPAALVAWTLASLFISAWLATSLSIGSTWVVIALWVFITFVPWVVAEIAGRRRHPASSTGAPAAAAAPAAGEEEADSRPV